MDKQDNRLDGLRARLHSLEQDLEQELDQVLDDKREQFRYSLYQGKVAFDAEMLRLQRQHRTGLWRYITGARIGTLLSAPVIYSLLPAFALLDLMVSIYQAICFPIYRVAKVRRSDYIAVDRHHLSYLNALEKVNCMYCGYGNGVIAYVREVSARTERYWCPIKHARRTLDPHRHVEDFSDYGDAANYHQRLKQLRQALEKLQD